MGSHCLLIMVTYIVMMFSFIGRLRITLTAPHAVSVAEEKFSSVLSLHATILFTSNVGDVHSKIFRCLIESEEFTNENDFAFRSYYEEKDTEKPSPHPHNLRFLSKAEDHRNCLSCGDPTPRTMTREMTMDQGDDKDGVDDDDYGLQRKSIPRRRYIASEGLNDVDKPSPKPLIISSSESNTQNHSVLKGSNLRNLDLRTNCAVGVCTSPENVAESHYSHAAEEKLGVLLLNLGGPETLNDVQPFLYNLFADPDFIRLPRLLRFLQQPLAKLISVLRAPKSKEGYASIGGGSPLGKITDEQADALRVALEAKNVHANVYVGMRYWFPFTEEAIEQIKRDRITKLVVLPLYPQFSISTTGSSIRVLQRIFKEDAYLSRLPVCVIRSWYQRQGYIQSMADLIEKELGQFAKPEETRVGPVQWLKPYTDEVLVEIGQKGVKSLLVVPISFVSKHIETLEEIEMEYKHLALESGIENWCHVPALVCNSLFITDLADAVVKALPSEKALSTSTEVAEETEYDPFSSAVKLFFGSILAFILLLTPRVVLAFRNDLF
ncbi:Ferrochelatase-2 [Hibiscus syriacus]|uniref:protoporphyrin ferrochelatase n=1 Tax=Hibiscus syriacus TaxID=106335 RepID=A0A6A2YNS4_HIBSY|nr:Ferrochelatase-2 [Hibiscus syriacus]